MKSISKLAPSALALLVASPAVGCHSSVLDAVDAKIDDGTTSKTFVTTASKVDLLFVVDNSASMGDKQSYLREAVPSFVNRLVHPNCIDPSGAVVAVSNDGACSSGKLEFRPVEDLHIGVISSSLGAPGSDACSVPDGNGVYPTHNDDGAHLLNRGGDDEHSLPDALPGNFLVWNAHAAPVVAGPGAPTGGGVLPTPISDAGRLVADVTDLIAGVHEHGCGYEAQLESMYRFLVQPDPYATVKGGYNGRDLASSPPAALDGVDRDILAMRRAFLRPDSLVAVVLLTDENDSGIDPITFGGRAWEYENATRAQGGTTQCTVHPDNPQCLSCRLAAAASDPACIAGEVIDGDPLNLRAFHTKQRFGVDTQFPIDRYVRGLTQAAVPDRNGEHPEGSFDYVGNANCSNPLFADELPTDPNADLCHLKPGKRRPESGLVYLTVIGGVPWQLLTTAPTDFSNGNDAPFKAKLDDADYTRILGKDPLRYDFTGADPHMLESVLPRAGVGVDAAHGREWDTKGRDLQFACVFDLPAPKDCDDPKYRDACDCETANLENNADSPLCDPQRHATQTKGKAYPAIRELAVARALGDQAIVGSICPRPGDGSIPTPGYLPILHQFLNRATTSLAH